jgi:hypothetical protein
MSVYKYSRIQGLGIAKQLRQAMVQSTSGSKTLSEEEAAKNFYLIDKEGLLTTETKNVRDGLADFVRKDWDGKGVELEDVVREAKPTIMIGTSTQAGAWTESIVSPTMDVLAWLSKDRSRRWPNMSSSLSFCPCPILLICTRSSLRVSHSSCTKDQQALTSRCQQVDRRESAHRHWFPL